ncbi:uncharacterized protein LOC113041835 [Carassius auratus]|uniref:Uncharacterized protein LOC113041835 n=1 Tax=Carassius auratus TaxID=7957 RepID=A0A6P6JE74_CARAU|nr:uncharacterized protein LOC113041835 [Carassius auratus]
MIWACSADTGPEKLAVIETTRTSNSYRNNLETNVRPSVQQIKAAGGIFGLILTFPDLIDNCEELIKNKHQTEASTYLKTKAKEILETVKKLKKPLNELQEMLNQIPEMECHIDLAQEMFGSQIYTRGTICMEYTQSQKQDTKTQEFILLCTKDIGVTKNCSTGQHKSGDNKNKRRKKEATSTIDRSLNQERKLAFPRKPPHKSKTKRHG